MTANWGLRRFARYLRRMPERLLHPLRRRKALSHLRSCPPPRFVLVACHGNICRSPYAAALLDRELTQSAQSAIRVESAGFVGWGRPCPPMAVEVAAARGLDLSKYRSNRLTPPGVSVADLIVVMDKLQARALRRLFDRDVRDVLILGDLDPEPIETRHIEDPFDQPKEVFERCYSRIDRCVRQLVQIVAHNTERIASRGAAPFEPTTPHDAKVAAGEREVAIEHHFTVDVEEYFQVLAFERHVSRADWERLESRVSRAVDTLLALLERFRTRATFFVLGWVAERHPLLVKAIAAADHEVASHGWDHRRVTEQSREQFRESVRRTKGVLEGIIGEPVVGFRAPSFSIVPGREWALDLLIEEGYRYDSSLFPITRPGYGYSRGVRDPHLLRSRAGTLVELPPTTLRRAGINLPAAGGAYFRLLPYALTRAAFRDCARRGVPGTFYVHPWEVDPDQPRLDVSWSARARHYGGLARTVPRLERLLAEFRFNSVRGVGTLARLLPRALEAQPAGRP